MSAETEPLDDHAKVELLTRALEHHRWWLHRVMHLADDEPLRVSHVSREEVKREHDAAWEVLERVRR